MFGIQTASRRSILTLLLIALSVVMIAAAPAKAFPGVIALPDGFQPEGRDTSEILEQAEKQVLAIAEGAARLRNHSGRFARTVFRFCLAGLLPQR